MTSQTSIMWKAAKGLIITTVPRNDNTQVLQQNLDLKREIAILRGLVKELSDECIHGEKPRWGSVQYKKVNGVMRDYSLYIQKVLINETYPSGT